MHEISLIENLLESVLPAVDEQVRQGHRVEGLSVTIGAMELHSAEAFRQALAVKAQGTPLDGAKLELTIVKPQADCESCGFKGSFGDDQIDPHNADPLMACPACGRPAVIVGGRGVQKLELLLDE